MSYANNDEVRGVLIQSGNERVLLPNATVAEMMSRVPVEPIANAPHWLIGQIAWHGWRVPLLSYAGLSGHGHETVTTNNKVVVLKALGGNPDLPYFALLTQTFPQLIAVSYDRILPDLFREGQAVVATGRMVDGVFVAEDVLAKHDETYMPKELADKMGQAHTKHQVPATAPAMETP